MRHDEGAVGDEACRGEWGEPEAVRRLPECSGRHGREERQEGREREDSGPWDLPPSQDEGPHGAEPADRRGHQDPGPQEGRVLGRQDLQGDGSRKEVAPDETDGVRPVVGTISAAGLASRLEVAMRTSKARPIGEKERRMKRIALWAGLALAGSGCTATVLHGKFQDVRIDSSPPGATATISPRSEEHTSELQSL